MEDAYQKLYEFIKNLVRLPGMTSLDAVDRIEKLFFLFYISVNGLENEGIRRECGNGRRHIVRRRKIDKEAQEDTTYRTIMVTSIFSLDNKMVTGRDGPMFKF